MANRDRDTIVNAVIIALLVSLPAIAWWLGEIYYLNLASRVVILAIAGVGLNLALGLGGMVSFGHAAFFGLGGYALGMNVSTALEGAAVVTWPIAISGSASFLVCFLVALIAAGCVAAIVGVLSLRTSGVYFIMITLAFAQMIYYLAVAIPAYGGEDGLPIYERSRLPIGDLSDPATFFVLCLVFLGLSLVVFRQISRSHFGAALRMARINEKRLATSGIEPVPIKLTAFVISALITATAGMLFADLNGFVGPSMLSWKMSGEIMIFVILGGIGRLMGPVIGATAFVLLETFIGGVTDRWGLFLGLALLSVVLFAKGGLIGLLTGHDRND
ncbi:MAG: branched-chain amino acid ABC transporter permease [Pseudomonadota bacterium]